MMRWATLRSDATIDSIWPYSVSRTSASGRSKSIDPRRRRRWFRISNSSRMVSNIGASSRYSAMTAASWSATIAFTAV
ncbi:hypothetical protein D3C83_53940 [compost metagenome]